jgi:hypothetical protein
MYLNFLGEVSAIVAESEATAATLAMVVRAPSDKVDEDDVDYYTVKLLGKDNVKTTYKVYMDDEDDNFPTWFTSMTEGTMVIFSADADRVITLDPEESDKEDQGIALVAANDEFTADGADLKVVAMTSVATNYDKQTATVGGTLYRFNSSSVLYNKHLATTCSTCSVNKDWEDMTTAEQAACSEAGHGFSKEKVEIATKWSSLCSANDVDVFADTDLMIVDGTRVRYCVFDAAKYQSEEAKYAVLVDVDYRRNADDDKVYVATLFVDGKEVEYELNVAGNVRDALVNGDLVNYTVSDDEITRISTVLMVSDIADKDEDESIAGLVDSYDMPSSDVIKARFEVDEVDDGYIAYVDNVAKNASTDYDAITGLYIDEDGCIIYDLRDGSWEMFDGSVEDIEGLHVVGFRADTDNNDVDILVIFE